jgi:hypothetical protein
VTQIQEMAPFLRQNGQKAVVVIASDGESSDGDVAAALRDLVVRLKSKYGTYILCIVICLWLLFRVCRCGL